MEHVHVDGVTRTQNDILKTHIKDIFTADNFEDVSLVIDRLVIRELTL